jgi:hypothetical protein
MARGTQIVRISPVLSDSVLLDQVLETTVLTSAPLKVYTSKSSTTFPPEDRS